MGNGRQDGGQLHFQATADFAMTAADAFRWRCAFTKASELLHNATEGQLRFGRIFVTTDGLAIDDADYRLTDSGDRAFATFGGFGQVGRSVTLPTYVLEQVLSLVHESGHHVFSLGEEYSFSLSELVDDSATLPSGHGDTIVPLQDATSERPDADFASATVILRLSDVLHTRDVDSKVGARVTVASAFPEDPRNATWATFQWPAECTDDRTTGACIMEFSRSNAGTMDAGCTWTPAADPVTEFCTGANHDTDTDTDQHGRNGEPCWDSIATAVGLTPPATGSAASKTPPTGFVPPLWIGLEPNLRVALVLDRSWSMNRDSGSRLQGVKTGATYWIENAALESDRLAIVWYATGTDTPLPLTDVSALSDTDREILVTDISNQMASGATNIRDALREGLTELLSPGTAAAVQATLLMTDGAHNTPWGSSMQEAVDEFQQANTNIYTLGVGSGDEVDRPGLAALANATNGSAWAIDDGSDSVAIADRMIEANNLIRGGIITTPGEIMPDLADVPDEHRKGERPRLKDLLALLNIDDPALLPRHRERLRGRAIVAFHEIEDGATTATFNLSHQAGMGLWLYLIAPDGTMIQNGAAGVRYVTGRDGFEFAKVAAPTPGRWTIFGYRSRPGPPGKVSVITGIQNPAVTVTATARQPLPGGVVELAATVRHGFELSGARVRVILRDSTGATSKVVLEERDDSGHYTGVLHLAAGVHNGVAEIVAPERAVRAGLTHAITHAEPGENLGPPHLANPRFRRHVPLSVVVDATTPEYIPEKERDAIEEKDDGRPVHVRIRPWEPDDKGKPGGRTAR